ncbi:MAG: tetratricopeptide repeat protein, partial [Candidatus Heimdallarchaeota archaeon]
MSYLKPKELRQAAQLIKEVKFLKALKLLDEFGKNKVLLLEEKVSYFILKSSLLNYLLRGEEILNYAEKAYQDSQNIGASLQLLDVYIQMAMGLTYKYKSGEPFEFIGKAEVMLKMLTEEPQKELLERNASIFDIKGWLYYDLDEKNKALEYAKRSLEIRLDLDLKADIGISLWQIGWIYFKNDNDLALKYVDQCIDYCEGINYKLKSQQCYMLKGMIYSFKGELDQAIRCFKLSKTLFEELPNELKYDYGNYGVLHLMGMVYLEKDELDKAKKCFEKALEIKEMVGANFSKVMTLDELISLSVYKNDVKSAENYLKEIKEISDNEKIGLLNLIYRINMAKLLKLSPIVSNQVKAEEMFKEILNNVTDNEPKIVVLLNLTDILLDKLFKTNNVKLLDEIQQYINQVHDIAIDQKSHSLLAETHLLQAKVELLTLDLEETQQFLEKAKEIAKKYGLNQLLEKILMEEGELVNQTSKWETLKNSKATIAELINLSHVNDQLTRMIKKRFL